MLMMLMMMMVMIVVMVMIRWVMIDADDANDDYGGGENDDHF